MPRVALTTIALLAYPYSDERISSFEDLIGGTFAAAEQTPGYVGRAETGDDDDQLSYFERDWGEWGPFAVPRFYTGGRTAETDMRASTLSLWADLDAVYAFVYRGFHVTALQRRREWFLELDWLSYCIWWVADDHKPPWTEACQRLEQLNDHGAGPAAFTFDRPFDALGQPTIINKPAR